MENFNTDNDSLEKIWYNVEASVIRDTRNGWEFEEFVEILRVAIETAQLKGFKSVKVKCDVEGGKKDMGLFL